MGRVHRVLAVALVAVLLASSLGLRGHLGRPVTLGILALAAVFFLVVVVSGARSQQSEEASDRDADQDVWRMIPDWQYTGRHVESGGLSRDDQERALADIQERAEELEERDRPRE